MENLNRLPGSVHGITSDESTDGENENQRHNNPETGSDSCISDQTSARNAKAVAYPSCTNEQRLYDRAKLVSAVGAAGAPSDLESSRQAVDPKRAEDVRFAASFMYSLTQGLRKGKLNKEIIRKRKERKRQINRASAKRKRVRAKLELEDLAKQCKELEGSNTKLKSENSMLSECVMTEMEKRSRYIAQIEQLKASMQAHGASSMPGPVSVPAPTPAPAAAATPAQNIADLCQTLLSSLNQTSEAGRLLQEYMQVERTRQEMLAQQREQEQKSYQQQLQALASLLIGGIVSATGASQPPPASVAPAPPVVAPMNPPPQQGIANQNLLLALTSIAMVLSGSQSQPPPPGTS